MTTRLINTRTLELNDFFGDPLPPYATLFNCWGPGELTYSDVKAAKLQSGDGLQKILDFCRLCRDLGLDLARADSCCIDQGNESERDKTLGSLLAFTNSARLVYSTAQR